MGFLNSIKDAIVNVGERVAESQDRKNVKIQIKSKILQRFSAKQLKNICYRYGDGPKDYEKDPFNGEIRKFKLTTPDYIKYATYEIKLEEVKDFAKANKIPISDILKEEIQLLRDLDKKWNPNQLDETIFGSPENEFLEKIIATIENFEPSRIYRDEQGYHNELQGWMKAHFHGAIVEHQTGSSRPDIVIDNRIAIEVKGPTRSKDLVTVADKCNRYLQHYDNLIVALFEVDVNERFYDEWLKGIEDRYPEVKIIKK
ncbi:hypothetical protein [Methanoregula sp.]|uniref:hypothetical protein n=1 Tax=Methanoregula sp. TaxID=2052170 RepID=UPI003C72E0BE